MLVAEFLGTGILTMVFLAVSKSSMGYPLFVSFAVGLALVGLTLSLGAVSGAHLNPAITLGLWTVRKVKMIPALAYIAAQLLGGIAAYALFKYLIGQSIPSNTDFESKVLIAETVGTFIFSLGWAAAVYNRYEAGKAAAAVGVSIILGALAASVANGGGLLNPAVALGNQVWSLAYVLGPVLGAVIGFNLYGLLFAPEKQLVDAPAKKKK